MGIPKIIDNHIELCEQGEIGVPGKPNSASHTIKIALPDNWAKNINTLMAKALRIERGEQASIVENKPLWFFGWLGVLVCIMFVFVLALYW